MKIKIQIFEQDKKKGNYEPEKYEFTGVWALEDMIRRLLEKYYGSLVSNKVLSYLRERRTETEES